MGIATPPRKDLLAIETTIATPTVVRLWPYSLQGDLQDLHIFDIYKEEKLFEILTTTEIQYFIKISKIETLLLKFQINFIILVSKDLETEKHQHQFKNRKIDLP